MKTLRAKQEMKVAVDVKTGRVLAGFGNHASFIDANYDNLVRAIIFPEKKRVYFRFYKPDGNFNSVDEKDRATSFDKCFSAWEILINKNYVRKSWKVLFAVTDKVVTDQDVKI